MGKPRENKHNMVYNLISRIAHRASFPSADGGAGGAWSRAIDTAAPIQLYYSAKHGEDYD